MEPQAITPRVLRFEAQHAATRQTTPAQSQPETAVSTAVVEPELVG